jgi:hypothetical protein
METQGNKVDWKPFLSELKNGQEISIKLKDGKLFTDVFFVDYSDSKLEIGTYREFEECFGGFIFEDVHSIKFNQIKSIEVTNKLQ